MNKRVLYAAVSVALAFVLGLFTWHILGLDGPDRYIYGDAGLGIVLFVVPTAFGASMLAFIIGLLTRNSVAITVTFTSVLMVIAWTVGIFVTA